MERLRSLLQTQKIEKKSGEVRVSGTSTGVCVGIPGFLNENSDFAVTNLPLLNIRVSLDFSH